MTSMTRAHVAAAWSSIAEPGDRWAGALRRALGSEEAWEWATSPYRQLPASIESPRGEHGPGVTRGWLLSHRRWSPRIETLNVDDDLEHLRRLGGRLVTPDDREWPASLADLEDAQPPALWVLGAPPLSSPHQRFVSIVGARAASAYGVRIALEMAFEFEESGLTVISGGAYGIDAAAHRGALDAAEYRRKTGERKRLEETAATLDPQVDRGGEMGGGREFPSLFDIPAPGVQERDSEIPNAPRAPTIAIICGGLGNLYPPGNDLLFRRIRDCGGLIVAEVPPSFRPARWRFLERNRLIAAWSEITVVPEAGIRSGALATANRAAELGREVAAVPGPVTSFSSCGPHALIRDGAALVECARDVRELMGLPVSSETGEEKGGGGGGSVRAALALDNRLDTMPPLARRVWEALPRNGGVKIESVTRAAGVSREETEGALLTLRLAGLVTCKRGVWSRDMTGEAGEQ